MTKQEWNDICAQEAGVGGLCLRLSQAITNIFAIADHALTASNQYDLGPSKSRGIAVLSRNPLQAHVIITRHPGLPHTDQALQRAEEILYHGQRIDSSSPANEPRRILSQARPALTSRQIGNGNAHVDLPAISMASSLVRSSSSSLRAHSSSVSLLRRTTFAPVSTHNRARHGCPSLLHREHDRYVIEHDRPRCSHWTQGMASIGLMVMESMTSSSGAIGYMSAKRCRV